MQEKGLRHLRRKNRVKNRISLGTSTRPRITVYRSNSTLYAQMIDDEKHITLYGADTRSIKKSKEDNKTTLAFKLGKIIADKAKELKISQVIFDRNGYRYHGRVKALCEGIRSENITV